MISNKGVENQVGSTRRQSLTEQQFQDMFFVSRLGSSAHASIRSQGRPRQGMVLMTCSTCRITTIPPQLFRVTLLRRFTSPTNDERRTTNDERRTTNDDDNDNDDDAYDSAWNSVMLMKGKYTINYFQYQDVVECVCMLNDGSAALTKFAPTITTTSSSS